jgi:hypothetical protein
MMMLFGAAQRFSLAIVYGMYELRSLFLVWQA